MSFEQIMEEYPDLEREDIQEALRYAAWPLMISFILRPG